MRNRPHVVTRLAFEANPDGFCVVLLGVFWSKVG